MSRLQKESRVAIPYLCILLLDGPMPAKKIIALGLKEGYTLGQLRIAKKRAGIKSIREGATGGGMRRWWWVL